MMFLDLFRKRKYI